MLTLITPTGERPFAFSRCEMMMARQDYAGPVRWIVVDDGESPTPLAGPPTGWARHVVRPDPPWRPGENTQARNLTAGLDEAGLMRGDGEDLRIVIIEDDDWYPPQWLSTVDRALDRAEMVGESHARYYNVKERRWARLNNFAHASLRSSALRGRAIDALRRALQVFSKTYDVVMWKDPAPSKYLFRSNITVGLKGLPGRPGIAAGHVDMGGFRDSDLTVLRKWIGDDAEHYAEFYDEEAMTKDRVQMYATERLKKYEDRRLLPGDAVFVKQKDVRMLRHLKFATDDRPEDEADAAPVKASANEASAKSSARSNRGNKKAKDTSPTREDKSSASEQQEREAAAADTAHTDDPSKD